MTQIRFLTSSTPHVLVTSKDAVQADGTVSKELVAIASDGLLRQGMETTMNIQQSEWADTNDYDSTASDTDRDSRLTTTDIDDQLLANAERADARRNSKPQSADKSREEAPLLTVTTDVDDILFLEELEEIRAGTGRAAVERAPGTRQQLENLAMDQGHRNGRFRIQG